jgi:hypothetical protein
MDRISAKEILRRFGGARDQAGVLLREEALGMIMNR